MKKIVKPTILFVVLIMMLSTLTGCKTLDNMRNIHAVWTTKGVYDSITLNGVEYKKVAVDNPPDTLSTGEEFILITEPDVPVLLAPSMSMSLHISRDNNFIYGYIFGDPSFEYRTNGIFSSISYAEERHEYVLFCKADIYDDVMKEIENGIEYTDYAYEYVDPDTRMLTYYFLTDEENEAINKVIKDVTPKEDDQIVYNYYLTIPLENISEDHYFARYTYEILCDELDNKYILNAYSQASENWLTYEVPDEMTEIFDNITEKSKIASEINHNDTEVYYEN